MTTSFLPPTHPTAYFRISYSELCFRRVRRWLLFELRIGICGFIRRFSFLIKIFFHYYIRLRLQFYFFQRQALPASNNIWRPTIAFDAWSRPNGEAFYNAKILHNFKDCSRRRRLLTEDRASSRSKTDIRVSETPGIGMEVRRFYW